MLLGYTDTGKVKGRFYEFQYKTIVRRNEKSKHFGCFKDNNLEVFEHTTSIFMRGESDFLHLINSWRCNYGIYSYAPLGLVSVKSYTVPEIVDMIYKRNKFQFTPYYADTGIEYIR